MKIVSAAFAVVAILPAVSNATLVQYDLVYPNSVTVNGAIYNTTNIQPTGTGVIDPFLTIQANGIEQGYNGTNNNFDTKRVPQYNHPIQLGTLQATAINGVQYYQFLVDVNEPNGGKLSMISLDMLKVYTSSTLQSSTSTDANGIFNGSLGTLVYNLDDPSHSIDNFINYDDTQHGSGSGDIAIFIPTSLFANAKSTDYLYMYQLWGMNNSAEFSSNGGFEETAAITQDFTVVPEVPAFLPLGGVLGLIIGFSYMRRRQAQAA